MNEYNKDASNTAPKSLIQQAAAWLDDREVPSQLPVAVISSTTAHSEIKWIVCVRNS